MSLKRPQKKIRRYFFFFFIDGILTPRVTQKIPFRSPPVWRRSTLLRYAHAADPVYFLRQNSFRHLTFETPFCRFYLSGHPTPTPPPKGTRGPKGPLGRMGPMGPFGVIPKLF